MEYKRTLASFWSGETLTTVAQFCIHSWARHNGHNVIYSHNLTESLPASIETLDPRVVPGVSKWFDEFKVRENPSGFSNLFRMLLLNESHSLWLDTDMLVLDSVDIYGPVTFGWESKKRLNGAVLSLPSKSVELNALIDKLEGSSGSRIFFGDLGPSLLTTVLSSSELKTHAFPSSEFYEFGALEIWKLYSKRHYSEVSRRLEGKRLIHLWNEASKLAPFKVDSYSPQIGSFLQKFDLTFWEEKRLPTMSNRQIESWRRNMTRSRVRNAASSLLPYRAKTALLRKMGREIPAGF